MTDSNIRPSRLHQSGVTTWLSRVRAFCMYRKSSQRPIAFRKKNGFLPLEDRGRFFGVSCTVGLRGIRWQRTRFERQKCVVCLLLKQCSDLAWLFKTYLTSVPSLTLNLGRIPRLISRVDFLTPKTQVIAIELGFPEFVSFCLCVCKLALKALGPVRIAQGLLHTLMLSHVTKCSVKTQKQPVAHINFCSSHLSRLLMEKLSSH